MRKILFAIIALAACISMNSCKEDEETGNPYEKNLIEGLEFLNENMNREGVVTTDSGLQYEVVREGDGKTPTASDKVRCHYEGKFIDGKVFDSSYGGQPIVFGLKSVIPGWTEGLQYMKEGAEYIFYIPFNLGYGAYGYASIPPYSTLIFKVELIEVIE